MKRGRPAYDGPPRARLVVMIPADLLDRLDVECEIATLGRSFVVTDALEHWLAQRIKQQVNGQ